MYFTKILLILSLSSVSSSVFTDNILERNEEEFLNIVKTDETFEEPEAIEFDNPEIEYRSFNETLHDVITIPINDSKADNSTAQFSCTRYNISTPQQVEVVNATRLASLLQVESNTNSNQTQDSCLGVYFYSASCPFSCKAAPHFNALARFFPDIKMVALDAMSDKMFNAQFGIFGLPTFILYHNGKPGARLNETSDYNLEKFARFITNTTHIMPSGKLVVKSRDFKGPISAVQVHQRDYYLLLSWVVIASQFLYSFYYSTWGRWLVDITLSAWREAEAQYHHID